MIVSTITLALLALGTLTAGLRRVPEGEVHSLYRRGTLRRVLRPGLHLTCPVLDRIGHRIDLGGHLLRFSELLGHGAVEGTVYWQVLEPELADAVIDEIEQMIRGEAIDALREEPMQSDRRMLGSKLKSSMNAGLRQRGMMVTRVELDFA